MATYLMKHELEIELKTKIANLFPQLASQINIELVSNLNKDFGEYSTNVAFKLAAKLVVKPEKVARQIVEYWGNNPSKVEIKFCDLGYINFKLAPILKMQMLSKLIHIDKLNIAPYIKRPEDFKSLQPFRYALVRHALKNLMQYTHSYNEAHLGHLKVGKCATSRKALKIDFEMLKFSCLATPLMQDWVVCDNNSFQTIKYAYERTYHVLDFLVIGFDEKENADSILFCLTQDELVLLNALIEFEDVIFMTSKTLSPQLLCKYLKNLARTIHYLYNKMTLVNGDAHKNFAIRGLLQAAQGVLSLSLQLLGLE
jgi:arginyl-tRNA synthetase